RPTLSAGSPRWKIARRKNLSIVFDRRRARRLRALACGPFFPPWLLVDEAGILEAPTAWLRDAL
ncbi:MAG TPA: hypothetical protein VIJ36_01605, partial [Thermoanaerobaculia bacterium]